MVIPPLGVGKHLEISSDGKYIPKKRITHYLSWPGKFFQQTIYSRMNPDLLEPVMIGHCLLWIMHYILKLQKRYPSLIWVRKEDSKSALRCYHLVSGLSNDEWDLISSYFIICYLLVYLLSQLTFA